MSKSPWQHNLCFCFFKTDVLAFALQSWTFSNNSQESNIKQSNMSFYFYFSNKNSNCKSTKWPVTAMTLTSVGWEPSNNFKVCLSCCKWLADLWSCSLCHGSLAIAVDLVGPIPSFDLISIRFVWWPAWFTWLAIHCLLSECFAINRSQWSSSFTEVCMYRLLSSLWLVRLLCLLFILIKTFPIFIRCTRG